MRAYLWCWSLLGIAYWPISGLQKEGHLASLSTMQLLPSLGEMFLWLSLRNSLVHTPWCAPDSLHFGGWLYPTHFLDRESPFPFWWSLTHPSKPSCKVPCTVMVPPVLLKWSHPSFSELTPQHSLLRGCHAYLNTLQLQLGFELSKRFAFAPLLPSNTRSIDIVGGQVL